MSLCAGCHSGCCRSFAVPVSGADILRIERDLGKDFWEFVCRWSDPQGMIAGDYAPHFRFADEPQTPFVIALKHQKSQLAPEVSQCPFLVECVADDEHPLGTARCGIYSSRPAACRVFPTKFDDSQQLAIISHVPEYGRADKNPLYQLCPRQWTPEDIDPLDTMQDLAVARAEMDFFKQLAAIWNRQPQSWLAFPDFLRTIYAQRVRPAEPTAERKSSAVNSRQDQSPHFNRQSRAA